MHILKNCPEKWVNSRSIMLATEISPDVLSLTIALFLRLNIWKMVPLGVYRWTHAWGGGGLPCLAHLVCVLCMVEVYGIFNLKRKYSISL